jgi:two-component system LytT family response regulator
MERIRTLIIDDEALARKRIKNLLKVDPDFDLIGECANGFEAVDAIKKHDPDLIFLDVQMPELDGFGVLSELNGDRHPIVIFVTAYDQYAIRAFGVHALDYLLKPFDDDRFEQALNWAKSQHHQSRKSELSESIVALLKDYRSKDKPGDITKSDGRNRHLDRVVIKTAGRVLFLKTADIDWIEAEGYYVRLHLGNKSHLLRETLARLEDQLDPSRFARIHRSAIINLDRMKELRPQSHGEYLVVLNDGTELKMSRSYRDLLKTITKT